MRSTQPLPPLHPFLSLSPVTLLEGRATAIEQKLSVGVIADADQAIGTKRRVVRLHREWLVDYRTLEIVARRSTMKLVFGLGSF